MPVAFLHAPHPCGNRVDVFQLRVTLAIVLGDVLRMVHDHDLLWRRVEVQHDAYFLESVGDEVVQGSTALHLLDGGRQHSEK